MLPNIPFKMKTVALAAAVAATSLPALAFEPGQHDRGGAVYVMTNAPSGNQILVFDRARSGKLNPLPTATVGTQGLGGGDNAAVDPLGSQNSLVYSDELSMLFAVNAGDNSVAAFDTSSPNVRPKLTDTVASGGLIPVSIAVSKGMLYVLNVGGAGAIATFSVSDTGELTLVGTLELGLSNASGIPFDNIMAPGQIGVDALSRRVILVHAAGQEMLVVDLDDDGVPMGELTSTPVPGPVPFAFDLTPYGSVLVAEAASSTVSVFDAPASGTPMMLTTTSVANGQAATCWIIASDDGYAYVSNTAANTLSAYSYTRTGGLELISDVAALTGGSPTDMTFAGDERFLYSLNAASGGITGFLVNPEDGSLRLVETETGLPASLGIQGIAARDY